MSDHVIPRDVTPHVLAAVEEHRRGAAAMAEAPPRESSKAGQGPDLGAPREVRLWTEVREELAREIDGVRARAERISSTLRDGSLDAWEASEELRLIAAAAEKQACDLAAWRREREQSEQARWRGVSQG